MSSAAPLRVAIALVALVASACGSDNDSASTGATPTADPSETSDAQDEPPDEINPAEVPAASLLAHVDPEAAQLLVIDAAGAYEATGTTGGDDALLLLGRAVPALTYPNSALADVLDIASVDEALHYGPTGFGIGPDAPERVTIIRTGQDPSTLAENLDDAGYADEGEGLWTRDEPGQSEPEVVLLDDDLLFMGDDTEHVLASHQRDDGVDLDSVLGSGLAVVDGPIRVAVAGRPESCLVAVAGGDPLAGGASVLAVQTTGEPVLQDGDFLDRRGENTQVNGEATTVGDWIVYQLAVDPDSPFADSITGGSLSATGIAISAGDIGRAAWYCN